MRSLAQVRARRSGAATVHQLAKAAASLAGSWGKAAAGSMDAGLLDAALKDIRTLFDPPAALSKWSDLLRVSRDARTGQPAITSTFTGVTAVVAAPPPAPGALPRVLNAAAVDAGLEGIAATRTFVTNVARILTGLVAESPLLLEGPPGVGKTAVVTAAADVLLGPDCCERINMSASMTVEMLFGSTYPQLVDGQRVFVWRDGRLSE